MRTRKKPPAVTYQEALDWLVKMSEWSRDDVVKDAESAAWFIAERAQRWGQLVAKGRPS